MSAFVVSRKHVAALVKFAMAAGVERDAPYSATMLMEANVASVNYRYGRNDDAGDPFIDAEMELAPDLSPVEALKLARCLDYQSCELPDWETHAAARWLRQFTQTAVSKLPGYDAARWAIA